MNQLKFCQLSSENRFPDCVSVELYYAPIEVRRLALKKPKEISLQLTIRFYNQTIRVPGGEVEFGLKRGLLDVRLTNGRMPLGKIELTAPFEPAIEVRRQQETGGATEFGGAVTGGAQASATGSFKSTRSGKVTIETKFKHSRIANLGTEENPIWKFSMEPHSTGQLKEIEPYLTGQLKEILGTIERTGEPCGVEATFAVRSQSDIYLLNSTGLLRAKNLSNNKTALLAREFFLCFIAPKLQPYLSHVKGEL